MFSSKRKKAFALNHGRSFDKPFSQQENRRLLELMETRFLIMWASSCDPVLKQYWSAQVTALYSKNLSLDSDAKDRTRTAFEKWQFAEARCRETNARFRNLSLGHYPERSTLVFSVMRKISKILGPAPRLSDLRPAFGPGTNVGCKNNTNARAKLAAKVTVSANMRQLVSSVAASHPFWPLENFEVSHGQLMFVPKNSKTDRAIIVEPILNTYYQKGAGDWIRNRLKKAGCDLNSQETNRNLARLGSVTGFLATLDLSSASDTLASAVVEELLPYDWWSLLDSLRTRTIQYEGHQYSLSKFSSMGNGFTFELESLIFFAIAKSVCENSQFVSVYGDDIIVPTRKAVELIDALDFFGFIPNWEKSFLEGSFRESCGGDYYLGQDVRPVFVKEALSVRQLFRLHNFFIRNHDEDTAQFFESLIPRYFRCYRGPDGYGDGHLIGEFVPIRIGRNDGWALCGFRSFTSEPAVRRGERQRYAAILYLQQFSSDQSTPISESIDIVRGSRGYKVRTVLALL